MPGLWYYQNMEVKASYPVRLRQVRDESAHWLKLTHRVYNEVVSLLIPIIEQHWDDMNQYKKLSSVDAGAVTANAKWTLGTNLGSAPSHHVRGAKHAGHRITETGTQKAAAL